ncbi:CBS domain-containing protein [Bacillus xiapuensis]|uniref:CBS domain-containing protein n=1 Tax=Bacillus xiapuensis TaxID=2014075 RepID=UPI000C2509A7|nr:CBS domain-containing protein [Bacillus xiapuensis]
MEERNERCSRFEAAFNRIHQQLQQLCSHQQNHPFIEALHDCARHHASVRVHIEELKQFAKLRNAIVHQKTDAHFYIAEPHEETVERIEQIDKLISEPAEALSISSQPVCTVELSTSITKVLQMIQDFSYSEYPVFEKGVCQGLLAGKDLLTWMANQLAEDRIDLSGMTVKNVLPHAPQREIAFLKKEANIFDAEYVFEDFQNRNKKLEAILITPNGTPKELPIGIITSWDLTKIKDEIL